MTSFSDNELYLLEKKTAEARDWPVSSRLIDIPLSKAQGLIVRLKAAGSLAEAADNVDDWTSHSCQGEGCGFCELRKALAVYRKACE